MKCEHQDQQLQCLPTQFWKGFLWAELKMVGPYLGAAGGRFVPAGPARTQEVFVHRPCLFGHRAVMWWVAAQETDLECGWRSHAASWKDNYEPLCCLVLKTKKKEYKRRLLMKKLCLTAPTNSDLKPSYDKWRAAFCSSGLSDEEKKYIVSLVYSTNKISRIQGSLVVITPPLDSQLQSKKKKQDKKWAQTVKN